MSFLRNVLHDLVEKKLWPVAVALLAALVAIPMMLGGGTDTPADQAVVPGAPATTTTPKVAGAQVVSLEQQAGAIKRGGKAIDPFVQHHVPKPSEALTSALQSTTSLVAGGSSGSTTSSASAGTTTSTGATGTTPATTPSTSTGGTATPKSTAAPTDTYKVNVRFGEAGSERTIDDIARLTPLPSSTDPFFVYMGIKADGKTAVFLISSDAVPTGDGKCKPSADACDTLELKVGDTEFFDLQTGTAGVVQYQLTLKSIAKGKASTKAVAAAAHVRESKAGRERIRAIVAADPSALAAWDFSKSLGVLVERTPDTAAVDDTAHVPADIAAAAQGVAAAVPAPAVTMPTPPTPATPAP